jgi:hypothetical protein
MKQVIDKPAGRKLFRERGSESSPSPLKQARLKPRTTNFRLKWRKRSNRASSENN